MSGLNKAQLIGRLGADPDVKDVNGNKVARLSIATSDKWTDKNGQAHERTEWHRVVVWGKLADLCGKFLAKGRQVYIEGRIQTREFEKNGQKVYTTEIVANAVQFLGDAVTARPQVSDDFTDPKAFPDPNSDGVPF